jgi:dihydroxy-acid dehydratase
MITERLPFWDAAAMGLRSERWFGGRDLAGFIHRTSLYAGELDRTQLDGRPVVGIASCWSELVTCNLHLRGLAAAARRGVIAAGGVPLEFPTISLGENLMKPTAMLFRNLMSMDVEECIRAYPLDAVVLVGGCDKTVPAQLMGALSADVPAIALTAGPAEPAFWRGRELGAGTDLWHHVEEVRAGRMTQAEFDEYEAANVHGAGHCNELGTASTIAALVEAMGMSLPGIAAIPAVDRSRAEAAEATGARAVALAREGLRPRQIVTAEALDNAITVLMALGGGTNAVVHLLALAGRAGVPLGLDRFDELSRRTPVLANVRPSGEHLFEDVHRAGGVGALLKELAPLLHTDALTVTGRTLGEEIADAAATDRGVIAALGAPRSPEGGLAVLRGTLAPSGAVIKLSAASPSLFSHRGPAVVFADVHDLAGRIDDVDATADSVLVLRSSGPKGGPGMPEWGQLPVPRRLLEQGVNDIVRISDARMSGTAFGTVVLHVAPESAAGGPLAVVRDGDPIVLDVESRRLDLDLPAAEIAARLDAFEPPPPHYTRGYGALYLEHVLQADEGCDFDFLRARPGEPAESEPLGLLSGWIGGW